MTSHPFTLAGTQLIARPTGALHWPDQNLLCVSDLHLGTSARRVGTGNAAQPPYETRDILTRLEADLKATGARTLVCLGDGFDDTASPDDLSDDESQWIQTLQAGRRWVWIDGNHGPMDLGGTHLAELPLPPLTFRHVARRGASGEISGHFHPKAQVSIKDRDIARPAFLIDGDRAVLPAYGTYSGGTRCSDATLSNLMRREAMAILTGRETHAIPMPR
ncbi:ligase-associated DNA damage response endonuclease PdeM [Roseovarius aestuarii]|nr:ligase-associated DNA damage response endonuclease PdeM [Roseovarius aestuarii]